MSCDDPDEPNVAGEGAYPKTDLEGRQNIGREARALYSISELRGAFGLPLEPGEVETWSDGVLFVSHILTGQTADLRAAREWFQKPISLGRPEAGIRAGDEVRSAVSAGCHDEKGQGFIPDSAEVPAKKSTDRPKRQKKSPTCSGRKSPTCLRGKSPSHAVPVAVVVVLGWLDLERRLKQAGQHEWATPVRVGGLLTLIAFIVSKHSKAGVPISAGLARAYVSAIKRPRSAKTIPQPLAVLERVGVLQKVRGAAFGPFSKASAAYIIPPELLCRKKSMEILVTPYVAAKLQNAQPRKDRRLNQKFPWRAPLIKILGKIDLSPEGHKLALRMALEGSPKSPGIKQLLGLIDRSSRWEARETLGRQITTSLGNCPKELKEHLLLDGDPVALCDISSAHFCIIPRIAGDFARRPMNAGEVDMSALLAERTEFIALLEAGDLYQYVSADPDSADARREAKGKLLVALNWRNEWSAKSATFQRLGTRFPQIARVIETIKRFDHKAIQGPLRYYLADAVNTSLCTLQSLGIDAIPDTDCLICPAEHKALVCRTLGENMFRVCQVRCTIAGSRFEPLP